MWFRTIDMSHVSSYLGRLCLTQKTSFMLLFPKGDPSPQAINADNADHAVLIEL